MSQKYLVAHFFEPVEPGFTFHVSEWPAHVTLLPRFAMHKSVEELLEKVEEIASELHPFQVKVGEKTMFGPNRDIPVFEIESDVIKDIHLKLFNISKELEIAYDEPEYVSEGFGPHTTIQKDGSVNPGQKYTVNTLAVVDMFPDTDIARRKVIKIFILAK